MDAQLETGRSDLRAEDRCPADAAGHATPPLLRQVLEHAVAHVFDVDPAAMNRPTRGEAAVAQARQVAMYLAHVGSGLSLTGVGRLFERDRTTVAHACRMIEERRDDPAFDRAMDLLESVVHQLAGRPEAR